MAKLQDLFTQARRAQSGGGIGFLGKNRAESKAHTAALVVAFPRVTAGSAEAALKAGADGLLFSWDGSDTSAFDALKKEIASAKAVNSDLVSGLHITGGWNNLNRDTFAQLKEQGFQYIVLPLDAPAHLLALETKEVEKVISVSLHTDESDSLSRFFVPLAIRSLPSLSGIAATILDLGLQKTPGSLTIEDVSYYRGLREVVHYPAFVNVKSDLSEADAHTLKILGIQSVILTASNAEETTTQQIKAVRSVLEKTFEEEKDQSSLGLR